MKWQRLPPAGQPIIWHKKRPPELAIPSYELVWVSSGTAALAFALMNHRRLYPGIAQPEVLVPGYCCPHLLAAARYAGYTPVVVDISVDDPGYDLTALERALTRNTLAVITINFLGIQDRLAAVRERLEPYPDIALIEDNAQWFPGAPETADFKSDYLIFSFGRGKAVELLGGGLVAVRKSTSVHFDLVDRETSNGTAWPAKAWLVNQLARPYVFYWLNKMPFIHLGHTEYQELHTLKGIQTRVKSAFSPNFAHYQLYESLQAETFYDQLFENLQWNQLAAIAKPRRGRLLRYPVLCPDSAYRDRILKKLTGSGLGATAMYGAELSKIKGVSGSAGPIRYTQLSNARAFAKRFLTLPTHKGVGDQALSEIAELLKGSQ